MQKTITYETPRGQAEGLQIFPRAIGDTSLTHITKTGERTGPTLRIPTKETEAVALGLLKSRKPGLNACAFVELTSLVPKGWGPWFYSAISENAPFSWGDNNRTLVTASDFARHCDDTLEIHGENTSKAAVTRFLNKLRALGETYIDLEN